MIYFELLWTFFKIGALTFGGGYAMLPLIQEEAIAHDWLDARSLIDFIAVSESTPGPFAVNMATYVGSEVGGILGAACATLGVVLPSFTIILLIAGCFERFRDSRIVKGCMAGLKPAVVGLIGAAAISVGEAVFVPDGLGTVSFADVPFWAAPAIFILSAILAFKKAHPILIICVSALFGMAFGLAPIS